jgi:sugar phosphate isomerase/epimerase
MFDKILENIEKEQPVEIGLECYGPRGYDPDSKIIQIVEENLHDHENTIVHLTLEAKLLNVNHYSHAEWLSVWHKQFKPVSRINPRYLIVHATSHESKTIMEGIQITNICEHFKYVESFFERPVFVENTYEDLGFYKKLFGAAPSSMNFTFDIGHMKVHSKRSQAEWIKFLKKLRSEGRQIHFHIHDNDSTADQHKTLTEIDDLHVINFVKELRSIFSESNFILESHVPDFDKVQKDFDLLMNGRSEKIEFDKKLF